MLTYVLAVVDSCPIEQLAGIKLDMLELRELILNTEPQEGDTQDLYEIGVVLEAIEARQPRLTLVK